MELKKMYEATAFSPIASLSKNIGADDTTIYVDNVSVFPAGPGLAITDTALTGCMRGVEGTAKAWPAGENIARNFTAKDWNDLKENVEALYKEMQNKCVSADWSVNAEDSPSHIKNRTHWKEHVAPDLVYLNATVNFKSNMASVSGDDFSEIVVGKTYIVYWNGALYECAAYTSNGEVFLGNGTLMSVTGAEHTGEPFCINLFDKTMAYVAKSTDSSETVSLKITPTGKVIYHKIDKNYLPDDYGNNSGGSSGGVSSWNDLTDKPFGEAETLIAAEKSFSNSDDNNRFTDLNSTMVTDGQEIVVYFDGSRYECKVKNYGDFTGNGKDLIATDNYEDYAAGTSALPFCLIFHETYTNIGCTSSGEHTASVYAIELVKIPVEYMPDYFQTSGGGLFVITLTRDNGYSVDKSFAEIKEAYESGKICILRYDTRSSIYQMDSISTDDDGEWRAVIFSVYDMMGRVNNIVSNVSKENVTISKDGSISVYSNTLWLESVLSTSGSGAIQNAAVATKFEELEESLAESFNEVHAELLTVTPLVDMVKIDGTEVLEISSDITNNPSVMDMLYLVSDLAPTIEDFSGGAIITLEFEGNEVAQEIPSDAIVEMYGLIMVAVDEVPIMIVNPIDNFEMDEISIPNKGTYVATEAQGFPIKKIKINGYMFGKRVIKGENVEFVLNSSTEGSTKKFKITVDDSGTISATEITA